MSSETEYAEYLVQLKSIFSQCVEGTEGPYACVECGDEVPPDDLLNYAYEQGWDFINTSRGKHEYFAYFHKRD